MLNTVTCWSTNIIISSKSITFHPPSHSFHSPSTQLRIPTDYLTGTFLSMMKGITPSGAFGFYCGICFVGWLFIVFFYPDVKGMPLETIREVFEHGFGRQYSKQWQQEHKHERKRVEAAFGH